MFDLSTYQNILSLQFGIFAKTAMACFKLDDMSTLTLSTGNDHVDSWIFHNLCVFNCQLLLIPDEVNPNKG